jgi:L-ascorbate metabolism protein UlaG (beta-lactamase superfamily)
MQFTYYGQSCFAIEVAGKKLLFDPFVSGNPLAKDIDVNSIEADYILVSHGHGDHVADLVSIAKRTGATIIAMYEIVGWAQKQGCEKGHGMNLGAYNFEFGEVRFVPAAHSSSLPDGSYGGVAAGIVVKTTEGNFYFAGDTCLTMDMQLVPRYAKLDFAIFPIGGNFTMNVEDAAIAAEFAQVDKVIGCHYDSFPPIKIDHDKARQAFKDKGKELVLVDIGQTISL